MTTLVCYLLYTITARVLAKINRGTRRRLMFRDGFLVSDRTNTKISDAKSILSELQKGKPDHFSDEEETS